MGDDDADLAYREVIMMCRRNGDNTYGQQASKTKGTLGKTIDGRKGGRNQVQYIGIPVAVSIDTCK
jgi:hypothetical protein